MPKIMIIEDDVRLRTQVKEVLTRYGYDVVAIEEFYNVEEEFKQIQPDLILLDLNLPHYDGNYYCRIIRRYSKIPIVIISARNSDLDQILSMEVGADEYIIKPFNIQVLIAKINALVRRLYGEYAIIEPKDGNENNKNTNQYGIILEDSSFKVKYNNHMEELSKNEFKLIKKFLDNINKVVSREELLEELWDASSFVDDNTLTVNVTRLKNKLASLGIEHVIKTKRGAGYIFDTSVFKEK